MNGSKESDRRRYQERKLLPTAPSARCAACGPTRGELPAAEFYANPNKKNGLSTHCIACSKIIEKEKRVCRVPSFLAWSREQRKPI